MKQSSKLDLIYKLEGEFKEGINVFEVSPILLHLGQLIQESNNVLYPDGRKISVNVKPFKEGSFEVDIIIFAANNAQHLIDLVNQDNVKQVKELLEWIGLVKAGVALTSISLIALIAKLKGKPKSVEKINPDEFKYTARDGNSFTVKAPVHQLFQNTNIQTAIFHSYGKPFENEKVKAIKTYPEDEEEDKSEEVVIFREEAGSFLEYKTPILLDDAEVVNKTALKMFLNPKRGNYEGGKGPYVFTVSGNKENKINPVEILDETFLHKLENGEVRLHYSDLIEADIELEQKVKDNEVVSTHYRIVRVINYKKAPKQIRFGFDNSNKEEEESK